MTRRHWIPEIMYEESPEMEMSSHIPFIPVPPEEVMPEILYVFESRETGEYEPGSEGEELPVTEMDLHQYADMAILKEGLNSKTYDQVRKVLGLQPMSQAVPAGQRISQNVRKNLES